MNILIASGIFHPDPGGPATYLYRLLPELQKRGHQIRVLTYGNAPVDHYPYPVTRIPFGREPFSRWIRFAFTYRRLASWAEVIYLNTFGLPRSGDQHKRKIMKVVGDYAWERCVTRGWIASTEDIDHFQTRRYSPRVELYKRNRTRDAAAMERVITPSAYLREMVMGWGVPGQQVQVIYNALEPNWGVPLLDKMQARIQLGWKAQGQYLFTAARLTAWKGVNYLIDALDAVPRVFLVVGGDGPEQGVLRQQTVNRGVADRVIFTGRLSASQMALTMRASDYVALYSGYEGLSHTILEALQVGTPVIVSARGGNPEIVRDQVNGLLVAHPDLGALRETLQNAFRAGIPERLASGTSVGLERFSWPDLVEQTMRVLEG